MKITKLAKNIKKKRRIITKIYKKTQIIGTGDAFYLMYGLCPMTEQEIKIVMDLGEGKGIIYEDLNETENFAYINFDDIDSTERPANITGLPLQYGSQILCCFESDYGLMFVDRNNFDPVSDMDGELNFYVRNGGGIHYLVVKAGMIVVAVINESAVICEDFVDKLNGFTNKINVQYSAMKKEGGA